MQFGASNAQTCSSNEDCSFGGICDTVLHKCTCNFECNKFTTHKYVCADKKLPMTECNALTNACVIQESVVITPFDSTLFRKTGSCKKMMTEPMEEFCEDQSYCSGNGICLRKIGSQEPFCRCLPEHSGDRCEKKTPVVMAVNSEDEEEHRGYGLSPAPLAAIIIASSAVTTLVIFYLGKKFFRPPVQQNNTESTMNGTANPNENILVVQVIRSLPDSQDSVNLPPRNYDDKRLENIVVTDTHVENDIASYETATTRKLTAMENPAVRVTEDDTS